MDFSTNNISINFFQSLQTSKNVSNRKIFIKTKIQRSFLEPRIKGFFGFKFNLAQTVNTSESHPFVRLLDKLSILQIVQFALTSVNAIPSNVRTNRWKAFKPDFQVMMKS